MRYSRPYKIKSILFGLILSIFILELCLNILSKFVSHNSHKIILGQIKDSYNILCIGDSYTYGVGAKAGYTYPEQLKIILQNNYPKNKFCVINAGVPGFNSSQMLKNLSGNIERYSPDLIIIWGGVDNCWNFTDTNYFLFADTINFSIFLKRLDSFLLKFRTYKLLKICWVNLTNKINSSNEDKLSQRRKYYLPGKNHQELLSLAKTYIENNSQDKKGVLKRLQMAYDVNKDPDCVIKLLKSYYPWEEFSSMVVDFFKLVGDEDTLARIRRTGIYKSYFDFNLDYKNQIIFDKLLQYDLEKMITLAKNENTKLILLTYPTDNMERGGDNFIIRTVAHKYDIPCVESASIFRLLLQKQKVEYYFVPGGHFNDNGYKVVAEEIYKIIKSDWYF